MKHLLQKVKLINPNSCNRDSESWLCLTVIKSFCSSKGTLKMKMNSCLSIRCHRLMIYMLMLKLRIPNSSSSIINFRKRTRKSWNSKSKRSLLKSRCTPTGAAVSLTSSWSSFASWTFGLSATWNLRRPSNAFTTNPKELSIWVTTYLIKYKRSFSY